MIPRRLADVLEPSAQERPLVGPADELGHVTVDGEVLVNMASCDYLGLARHPRVVAAAQQALATWGLGTAATRSLSGNTTAHRALERALAGWVSTRDAVLFSSCWTANAAVTAALASLAGEAGTTLEVFSDRLNHASIIDAVKAQGRSVSRLVVHPHGDLDALAAALAQRSPDTIAVVVTDGVFSMEGDQADVAGLVALAREHGALLVVDDSHGVGVVGATGRGCAQAQGVLGQVDVVVGTLGKALGGGAGGFVATGDELAGWLRRSSRSFVFSNNPPVPVVAGALAALEVLGTDGRPLATVRQRTARLREGIADLGLPSLAGDHPIVPVVLGDEGRTAAASASLRRHGVFATALSYPIVPRGQARLRLQVSAAHTTADVDRALGGLEEVR